MNLIEIILELMQTDDDNTDKQSDIVKGYYNNATQEQKELLDKVFISLCGYSLDTMINKPEDLGDEI